MQTKQLRLRKRYLRHFLAAFRRLYGMYLYYHSSGIVVLWTTTLHFYPLHQDFEFNATVSMPHLL